MSRRSKAAQNDGHHGGAWKVAYADFVTAMMAFFLMMWLLNATTEDQRKGIADYFSPQIPVSAESGGGESALYGDSATSTDSLATTSDAGAGSRDQASDSQFGMLRRDLEERVVEAEAGGDLSRHFGVRLTDEGLIVDLFALEDAPLFTGDGTEPTPLLQQLVEVVDQVFANAENDIAIGGFTASDPVVLRDREPWSVSAARAEMIRAQLARGRTGEARQARLTAHADNDPLHPDPIDPRNDRIELILLRD